MGLTDFVKRPRVRDAFDQFAAKLKTPAAFAVMPARIPDSRAWPPGLVGTAFDYFARMRMERDFRGSGIAVHRQSWISETVRELLEIDPPDRGYIRIINRETWKRDLDEAHESARAYIAGNGCARCFSLLIQYMAHADLLIRNSAVFEPTFDACGRTARELTALIGEFEPQKILTPRSVIVLNPMFPAATKIGGADGDLLIDDLLVDIKTVDRISLSKTYLRQLAGYAALHALGGVHMSDSVQPGPISRLGVYFARHGQLLEVSISALFPNDGFKKYRDAFEEELHTGVTIRGLPLASAT